MNPHFAGHDNDKQTHKYHYAIKDRLILGCLTTNQQQLNATFPTCSCLLKPFRPDHLFNLSKKLLQNHSQSINRQQARAMIPKIR